MTPDDLFDADDAKKQQRHEQEGALRLALNNLMTDPQGQVLLAWLLDCTGEGTPVYNSDPLKMAHDEGVRSVGLLLRNALLRINPSLFTAILLKRNPI